MTSVVPPLHSTRLRRTRRISPASAMSAARSPVIGSVGVGAPSGIGHPIADAANGLDQAARGAQLLAEVVDVGVDRIRGDGHAEWPGLVQELVARQGLARMAEEALEQRELAWGEIHGLAVEGHPSGGLVQGDRADDELGLG